MNAFQIFKNLTGVISLGRFNSVGTLKGFSSSDTAEEKEKHCTNSSVKNKRPTGCSSTTKYSSFDFKKSFSSQRING
jgi:hypothetical protein